VHTKQTGYQKPQIKNTKNKKQKQKEQSIQWLWEKENRANNDLQNTTHKTDDWVTRTPLNPGWTTL
jgi:hypothetical protein